eukprot:8060383-Pyramimonas_sp.AAC.1
MGAGRSCVVSATHMSYHAPDSDPCGPKDSNANPMASQVVVGCGRLGSAACGCRPAREVEAAHCRIACFHAWCLGKSFQSEW